MPLPWLLGAAAVAVVGAIAASGSSDDDDREYERQLRREQREREAEARRERLEQAGRNAALQVESFTHKHGLPQYAAQPLYVLHSEFSLDDQTISQISAGYAQISPKVQAEDQRIQSLEARKAELNRAAQILNALVQNGASRG